MALTRIRQSNIIQPLDADLDTLSLSANGNITATGDLTVGGNTAITGSLTVDGSVSFSSSNTAGTFTFGDNDKLLFGDGNDLQVFHNASHSYIDNYTGNLYFNNNTNDGTIQFATDDGSGGLTAYVLLNGSDGSVTLNHYGSEKLITSNTGISVTGDVVSSGNLSSANATLSGDLTVNGVARIEGVATGLVINETDTTDLNTYFTVNGGNFRIHTTDDAFTSFTPRLVISNSSGTVTVPGDLVVDGDFTVSGTTTTIDTDNLAIEDLNIVLANGAANSSVADGAGITIDGAGALLTYDDSYNSWKINKDLRIQQGGSAEVNLEHTGAAAVGNYIGGVNLHSASYSNIVRLLGFNDDNDVKGGKFQLRLNNTDASPVNRTRFEVLNGVEHTKFYPDTISDQKYVSIIGHPSSAYNLASSGDVDRVVSGLRFNWYSGYWQIGAERSGGAGIAALTTHVDGVLAHSISTSGNQVIYSTRSSAHAAGSAGTLRIEEQSDGVDAMLVFKAVADNAGVGNTGAIWFDAGATGVTPDNKLNFSAKHQENLDPSLTIHGSNQVQINGSTDISQSIAKVGNDTSGYWEFVNGGNPTTRVLLKAYDSSSVETIRLDPNSGADSFVINDFGIGENNPDTKLHVSGTVPFITIQDTSGISNGQAYGGIKWKSSNDNINAKIIAEQDGGTSGGALSFYTRTYADGTNTDGGEERLHISDNGHVYVRQNLYTEGFINNTILKVSAWSNFVSGSYYYLCTLNPSFNGASSHADVRLSLGGVNEAIHFHITAKNAGGNITPSVHVEASSVSGQNVVAFVQPDGYTTHFYLKPNANVSYTPRAVVYNATGQVYIDSNPPTSVTDTNIWSLSAVEMYQLGIGEPSPLGKLHVKDGDAGAITTNNAHDTVIIEGSDNTGINIFSPSTSYQYLAFGDPTSSNAGYVRYYHVTDQMVLRAGQDDVVFINAGVMTVDGNFNATTKSFDIKHPTKEGMRLHHGSLEGPEHGVYVRGRLKDNNTIELPDYWIGLVDEDTITVQLTAIGGKQDVWVEDVINNTITVGSSTPINCFYFVQAERKDIDKFDVEYEES